MTPAPAVGLPHLKREEIFDARIQTRTTPPRYYRVAAHRFLAYLQTDFPQVLQLSELRRDPHLLGWLRCLCEQDPPLSSSTRRIYLVGLRRLLHDFACEGHSLQPGLILSEDFPPQPRRSPQPQFQWALGRFRFGEIFDSRIQTFTTDVQPRTTQRYRGVARRFLAYLQTDFPQVLHLSELRRDPHLFGWFRRLCEHDPPLSNVTRRRYLLALRRLLVDLAFAGHPLQPNLILTEDFPPRPEYLPRALSPEDDRQLQQELSRTNDLLSNALLLTRATGIRIGECIHLALDCLRSLGPNHWGLHVPLAKLPTDQLLPVDSPIPPTPTLILSLRALAPASHR